MHANENLTRADVMLQPPAGTEPTSPTEPLVLLVFHSSRYEGTSACDSEDSFRLFVSILVSILDSTLLYSRVSLEVCCKALGLPEAQLHDGFVALIVTELNQ